MITDELAGMPQAFRDHLGFSGIVYDDETQVDLLAAMLGSQFVLFAGPSGTGKSTAARMLTSFFVPEDRCASIDVRPGWASSEDTVGQYSVFAGQYTSSESFERLRRIAGIQSQHPSVVTIEEANLSPIEAYAGPLVTASSETSWQWLHWRLHDQVHVEGVPPELQLGPWPRFLGTVNVDSSAPAPAPKVTGRTCVVLLEPPAIDDVIRSADAITSAPPSHPTPPGSGLLGNPGAAWAGLSVNGGSSSLLSALRPLLEVVQDSAGRGANVVTPRDLQRCVQYMAWHVVLARAAASSGMAVVADSGASAEMALLHFVLPGLSSEQFRRALPAVLDNSTERGTLRNRLTRLVEGGDGLFGVPPDFWASLS